MWIGAHISRDQHRLTKRVNKMKSGSTCDREHDFTLILSGVTELTDDVANALYSAGCDDATLSMRHGVVFLTFSRRAATLREAIFSAIRDVRRARTGADVERVDASDLVSQSEIARRASRSRQQIHQYITGERGAGRFPPPVCHISEGTPLWMWCAVARWLRENNIISEMMLQDAKEVAAINAALELRSQTRMNSSLMREVQRCITTTATTASASTTARTATRRQAKGGKPSTAKK
jgi:hypothetical protein